MLTKPTKVTVVLLITLGLIIVPLFGASDKNYTYLALGDSVSFGMNLALFPPYAAQVPTPDAFIGYPEALAAAEHLLQSKKEVNASCPGETSGSFLSSGVVDNGCNSPHPPFPAFKPTIGLHTNYTGPQIEFAESELANNKHINLVTLSIGANDVLLVLPQLQQCGTDVSCAQAVLGPVLQTYFGNLAQILVRLRARYRGTLILVNYYSPAPALDDLTFTLNTVMAQAVAFVNSQPGIVPVRIADGFTAFQNASAAFNDDACQAGLLIPFPPLPPGPPCDIHPSAVGRNLLAATIMSVQ